MTGQSPSPDAPQGLSVLEAVLERITYANEDTGYTIARVATERTGPDLPRGAPTADQRSVPIANEHRLVLPDRLGTPPFITAQSGWA